MPASYRKAIRLIFEQDDNEWLLEYNDTKEASLTVDLVACLYDKSIHEVTIDLLRYCQLVHPNTWHNVEIK